MDTETAEPATERDQLLQSGHSAPSTNHDGDSSSGEDGVQPTIEGSKLKLIATSFDFWTAGVAMAAVGVLLPDIEQYYGTDDATTAFIFPASLLGYLLATALVEPVRSRLGLRGIAAVSPLLRLFASLVVTTGPTFVVLLLANFCFGLGTGLTDTAWNAWASRMSRPSVAQGFLHGSFSFGCILGPVFAVAVIRSYPWHAYYLLVAALVCVDLVLQSWAFRDETKPKPTPLGPNALEANLGPSAFRSRAIWICALFFFLYQGVESVFTDWIVVYMQRVQHIDSTVAGLSSSVLWSGNSLGRYCLGPISDRLGVRIAVSIYIVLAIVLQASLGLAQDATAALTLLGLNGFLIAPLYPSGIIILVSYLPRGSQLTAVAVAMGLGQMGAAMAPLGVGFMATHLGMRHLIEAMCGLSILMLFSWVAFARLA